MQSISIIIPAYNEQNRIPATLSQVVEFFDQCGREFEVVVVDDGSKDFTAKVVQDFAEVYPQVRLLSYAQNRGKGFAVRHGILNARYERVLFNDADGSTNIEEVRKLDAALDIGADVAIGSRNVSVELQTVNTSQHRKQIGNLFNAFVQLSVLPGVLDTQCGFKLFNKRAAQSIFTRMRVDGFAFDVELLVIGRLLGLKISEIPINWTNAEGSKVNLMMDPVKMGSDVARITLRKFLGSYKKQRVSSTSVEVKPTEQHTPKQTLAVK